MIEGFYTPFPPTTAISLHSDGKYALHEQEVICGCLTSTIHVGPGKRIILVGINGRYNVTVPVLTCTTCLSTWTANLADLIKNGYWPATVNCDIIYHVDLFSSFEELKVSAPGMSRLAFMRILEQRTDYFGRNRVICGDTFQKSFFEWTYCRSEMDQVCDIQYFDFPACSPSMLAVSVDGNKKLYQFKKGVMEKGYVEHPSGQQLKSHQGKQTTNLMKRDSKLPSAAKEYF
ncbi:uncharacterized protein LOC115131124 [Oncorhynchus nerka]|uniref:uncharacterized protein LOC115131124 n=1 Tax=Oncorhynchus nerka TaxID=8023 RepID=UPI0031B8ACAF